LARGEASPRAVLAELNAATAPFLAENGEDPFANLNRREDLAAAHARLTRARLPRAIRDDRA